MLLEVSKSILLLLSCTSLQAVSIFNHFWLFPWFELWVPVQARASWSPNLAINKHWCSRPCKFEWIWMQDAPVCLSADIGHRARHTWREVLMFYYIYSGEFSSFSLIIISLDPELWQYSQFHMTCGQSCNFEMQFGIEIKQWATLWLLNISVFMSLLFPFSWLPLRWITRSQQDSMAITSFVWPCSFSGLQRAYPHSSPKEKHVG